MKEGFDVVKVGPNTKNVVIWGTVVLSFVLALTQRLSVGAVAEDLVREFGYSGSQLGLITSAAMYAYAIMQVPAGFMVDSLGVRNVCGFGLIMTALGSLLFAISPNIGLAIASRVLIGVGTSGMMLSVFKLQTELFDPGQFSALSGIVTCCGNVGVLLAMSPFAILVSRMGWRETFYLLSAVTFALAIVTFVIVPKGEVAERMSGRSMLNAFKKVIFNPRTWAPFGVLFTVMGIITTLNGLWGIPYVTHVYGVDKVYASKLLSAIPIGFIVGGLLLGRVCTAFKGDVRKVMISGSTLLALVMAFIVICGGKPPAGMLPVVFFVMGLAGVIHILAFTKCKEVNPPELSGVASGVVNMGEFIGSSIFGQVFGYVLDRKWDGTVVDGARAYNVSGYGSMFIISAVVALGSIFCCFKQTRNKNMDEEVSV